MRRSTVVMLVILALLAGLYGYMQQPDNVIQRVVRPTPTATNTDLGNLIGPEKGQATRIFIQETDGPSLELDKSTGIWLLKTDQGSLPAEPETVNLAASNLLSLRILGQMPPSPNLEAISLNPPAYRFSISMSDGSQVNFTVGAKTVIQSGYYVQTPDGSVYIVAAYNIDSLIGLLAAPPYLQTPTPSPAAETALPSATPEPTP